MKGKRGLLGLLTAFISSLLTVTAFGYWNFSSSSSQIVTKAEANTEASVNQYTEDRAVCYWSDNTSVYYTSIEKGLSVSHSSGTLYVVPGLKDSNGNSFPIHISHDCTIPSGVTLSLPYSDTTSYTSTYGSLSTFADSSAANVKTYRQTLVVVDEGVTVTVSSGATLTIGGIFGRTGQSLITNISGNYCELALAANAKVISYGTVNSYGFIKEYGSKNNGSMFELKSGKMTVPFTIYDFQGGTITTNLNSAKICPFEMFDIASVQTLFRINYGASVTGIVRLNVSIYGDVEKSVTICGTETSNNAIIMQSGYIDIKYNPATFGYTSASHTDGTNTIISLNGEVKIGYFSLSISIATINTQNMYFPLSYRFNFNIKNGAIMHISYAAKLLPGHTTVIEPGGTMSVENKLAIYNENFTESTSSLATKYPKTGVPANFINNGTVTVTSNGSVGGLIKTTSLNSTLNLTSASSLSVTSREGNDQFDVNLLAKGTMTNGTTLTFTGDLEKLTYPSSINPDDASLYAWYNSALVKPEPKNITSVSLSPEEASSAKATAGNIAVTATVNPDDHESTNVSYQWSCTNSAVSFTAPTSQSTNIKFAANTGNSDINYSVTCTVTFTKTDGTTGTVSATGTYTAAGNGCIPEGTMITMQGNTKKPIESINKGDMVLTWNFFKGKYEAKPVIALEKEYSITNVVTVELNNGNSIRFISYQAFFDVDSREYFKVYFDNYEFAIGKNIALAGTDSLESAKIVSITVKSMAIAYYEIITANNFNFIADGILTCEPYIFCMNLFTINENFMYDPEEVKHDIDVYGLFTYDEWSEYMTEDEFNAFNGQYFKIAIGKGIITYEDIFSALSIYNNDYSHDE